MRYAAERRNLDESRQRFQSEFDDLTIQELWGQLVNPIGVLLSLAVDADTPPAVPALPSSGSTLAALRVRLIRGIRGRQWGPTPAGNCSNRRADRWIHGRPARSHPRMPLVAVSRRLLRVSSGPAGVSLDHSSLCGGPSTLP
jgi:hypothetical protein